MLLLPDPLGTTASALSPSFHDSPLVPSGRGIPVGGRYEVRTRGEPFVRPPARRRRNCQGCGHDLRKIVPPGRADGEMRGAVRRGNNLHLSVFSPSFPDVPLVPSGRGKGACYGGVAPLRAPFPNPRITPLASR